MKQILNMLTNATITRIDRVGSPDAAGRPRMVQGTALPGVHCTLDQISGRQRYTLGAVLEDADQVVFVERDALTEADESLPAAGDQLVIQIDDESSTHTVTVITTGYRLAPSSGALSHSELFVRREP